MHRFAENTVLETDAVRHSLFSKEVELLVRLFSNQSVQSVTLNFQPQYYGYSES